MLSEMEDVRRRKRLDTVARKEDGGCMTVSRGKGSGRESPTQTRGRWRGFASASWL
jgi:hypothetical protein